MWQVGAFCLYVYERERKKELRMALSRIMWQTCVLSKGVMCVCVCLREREGRGKRENVVNGFT